MARQLLEKSAKQLSHRASATINLLLFLVIYRCHPYGAFCKFGNGLLLGMMYLMSFKNPQVFRQNNSPFFIKVHPSERKRSPITIGSPTIKRPKPIHCAVGGNIERA